MSAALIVEGHSVPAIPSIYVYWPFDDFPPEIEDLRDWELNYVHRMQEYLLMWLEMNIGFIED